MTGVPIGYGEPSAEMLEALQRGEVVIGGCMKMLGAPTHQCSACGHEWNSARRRVGRHASGDDDVVAVEGGSASLPDFAAIEKDAERIVRNIARESVAVYCFLADEFARTPVAASDPFFQFVYRSFYRLDNAGLTDQFKERYFKLMGELRGQMQVDLGAAALELHRIPNRKGQQTLQFSFVSKLANIVTGGTPIYDAEVARVFGFQAPNSKRSVEERLAGFMRFHSWLDVTYAEILRADVLTTARGYFAEVHAEHAGKVSDIKVLDFVFWSAGKLGYRVHSKWG